MKIVQKGKLNAWWDGRKPVCLTCATKLELDANDIPLRINADKTSDMVDYAVFLCLNCGSDVEVIRR